MVTIVRRILICLFVYFAIILSTFRLVKGQQYYMINIKLLCTMTNNECIN